MRNRIQKRTRTLTIQIDTRYGYLFRKEVPKLRLTGLWLMKAGFKPGEKVTVEIGPNKLILKPEAHGNK